MKPASDTTCIAALKRHLGRTTTIMLKEFATAADYLNEADYASDKLNKAPLRLPLALPPLPF